MNQSIKAFVAGIALISTGLTAFAVPAGNTFSEDEIRQIVREYILDHGDLVLQAVGRHHERQRMARTEQARDAIRTHAADLFQDEYAPSIGPANRSDDVVNVIEFFDYRCGYCKRMAETIRKVLSDNPGVRFIAKELPILGPESNLAARAALAASKQNAYARFHEALMGRNEAINVESIDRIAAELKLDLTKLKTDMESPDVREAIQRNHTLAGALQINSTPTFIVGSELVAGGMDAAQFQALIKKVQTERNAQQSKAGK